MPRLRVLECCFGAALLAGTACPPAAFAQAAPAAAQSQQPQQQQPQQQQAQQQQAQQEQAQQEQAQQQQAEGSVSRADYIAAMDEEFRKRDADHDGFLTRAELEQYERMLARGAALNRNHQIFLQLDADHNGVLSPNEFAALVGEPPVPDVSPQMKVLDQDRDGKITIVEHRAAKLVNFDKLDTDFNGIVTDAEMKAGNVPVQAPSGR